MAYSEFSIFTWVYRAEIITKFNQFNLGNYEKNPITRSLSLGVSQTLFHDVRYTPFSQSMWISQLGIGVLVYSPKKLSFIEKNNGLFYVAWSFCFKKILFTLYRHVVFDWFFHFITICSYISCFFIYHLSIIGFYSKIIHLTFIKQLYSPQKERSSYWNITWLDISCHITFT